IDRLHPARLRLRVIDLFDETPSARTLRLAPRDGYLPPFQAGQYLALFLEIGNVRTSRPYSLSSPPNQIGHFDITVRRVPGGLVSNHLLDRVRVGDEIESSGPAGQFYHHPLFHDRDLVFLAGGSGITPFMSLIRETVERGLDRTIHLFYGNKTLEETIFHQALSTLAARHPNVHYHPVLEDPPAGWDGLTGLLTGTLIQKVLGGVVGRTFYLCGPQAMYDFCVPELQGLGVPGRKIRKEVYGPPAEVTRSPGWPPHIKAADVFTVRVNGRGGFQAKAGETLLATLEKNGLALPSLCRSGECSQCRVKVVKGKVFQPAGALVRRSDRRYGYVHSCVSYPLEDLEIIT
ncbi:MAG: FAD-binding oxidoreductase, partial [Thermodesulfobacteriota bacterium]